MFEIGKTYNITMLEGTVEATYTLKVDKIEGYLIKCGNKIINTQSNVFISAECKD
jgi:hypothetical protein